MTNIDKLHETLGKMIRDGFLTIGRFVDNETLVCFTQYLSNGVVNYHQLQFEVLPLDLQKAFKGLVRGDKIGNCKIVGVWDMWQYSDLRVPLGKNCVSQ